MYCTVLELLYLNFIVRVLSVRQTKFEICWDNIIIIRDRLDRFATTSNVTEPSLGTKRKRREDGEEITHNQQPTHEEDYYRGAIKQEASKQAYSYSYSYTPSRCITKFAVHTGIAQLTIHHEISNCIVNCCVSLEPDKLQV